MTRCSPGTPTAARLLRYVEKQDAGFFSECWTWTGYRSPDGYGRISGRGRSTCVHRVSYETFVGTIPDGFLIDHLCRNRACINPAHLEPVTNRENVLRGITPQVAGLRNRSKTHCAHGHPFDEANTYHWKTKRLCRACDRQRKRHSHRRLPMRKEIGA